MRGKTEKIDKILKSILLKKGITKNLLKNKIKTIIHNDFSCDEWKHIRVGFIKNNKLYIYIDSSSMLYEIKYFKKDQLIENINTGCELNITDIIFMMESNKNG